MLPPTCEDLVAPAARLVSCVAQRVPLGLVNDLEAVVSHLSAPEQQRALQWCAAEGVYEAAAIADVGGTDAFLDALDCERQDRDHVARKLRRL